MARGLSGALVGAALVACIGDEAQHKAAGNILFRRGDIDGALREYGLAAEQDPRDAEAQILLGNALFEQERYPEARAAFARGLALTPEALAGRRGLAKVALRLGQPDEAEKQLRALLARDGSDHEAVRDLAAIAAGRGDLAGAEELLRRALALARNDARTLYPLAIVQARRGRPEEALATADALAAAAPARGWADYARAVAHAAGGRPDAALDALSRALDKGVDDPAKVESDDNLAPLRAHPRFRALLDRARAR